MGLILNFKTKFNCFFFNPCRTEALANQIFDDFKNQKLVCLCVLKGGYRFFSTLVEKIQSKNRNSDRNSLPMSINFIQVKTEKYLVEKIELIDTEELSLVKGKVIWDKSRIFYLYKIDFFLNLSITQIFNRLI